MLRPLVPAASRVAGRRGNRSTSVVASMRTDGKNTSPRRHSSTRSGREPELVAVERERGLDVGAAQHDMVETR